MNDSKKVNLDPSRLYGFKIVQDKDADKSLSPKIGEVKVLDQGGRTLALSAKIGRKLGAKMGFKKSA